MENMNDASFAFPENIKMEDWGVVDGREVKLFTLKNRHGLMMRATNYGCIVTELHVPDRHGKMDDVVLGHENLEAYTAGHPYFGSIVGRCANRIANGRFELDGQLCQLACNNGPNHLHGGVKGFDRQVWNASPAHGGNGPAIRFSRTSPHGEEGYPGNLEVSVTYILGHDNELRTEIKATTDAATVCNIAQHNYWNLAGHDSGPVTDHILQINAANYTPVDDTLIPTGEIAPVYGSPFDFSEPKPIGKDLAAAGDGFDHNFVLGMNPGEVKLAARVVEPGAGRVLALYTNQPGLQFYSGNLLDGSDRGKRRVAYQRHCGFCLEAQHFPDAIHHPDWPSVILRPGQSYYHVTGVRFMTD